MITMNWIPIGSNWTILFKCLEMTFVVIWRYINKTELNWIESIYQKYIQSTVEKKKNSLTISEGSMPTLTVLSIFWRDLEHIFKRLSWWDRFWYVLLQMLLRRLIGIWCSLFVIISFHVPFMLIKGTQFNIQSIIQS